jgi:hypothetical protein
MFYTLYPRTSFCPAWDAGNVFALHGELIGFAGFVNNNQDVIRRWQRRSSICITARRFSFRGCFLLIFGTCFSIVGSFRHFLFLWIVRVCFTTQ